LVLIRVKELNPFNSGLDHVRSSSDRKRRARSYNLINKKGETRAELTFNVYCRTIKIEI